ncbi:hypothetical protein LBW89_11565 [Paenibacillus sp. alder61]|uniref:hypothetical protein n=1 Tax=Paenibacillus TaxID=44249 RepID=UPI001CD6F693|nr:MULTISPECIES: hypothetical protein [Paenibacillus]MCA1293653.1 hypothetical protein [Paenibacillus sp. alder61]
MTPWLEFFIDGLAEVFQEAAAIVTEKSVQMTKIEPDLIRRLDPQQRMVFAQLSFKQDTLTTSEMRDLSSFVGSFNKRKDKPLAGNGIH